MPRFPQEGKMVDRAVPDPETFLHVFEGGGPAFSVPAVQGTVEGLLGGPDTSIAIDLALNPPAIGNPDERFIAQTVEQSHLNLTVELSIKGAEPEALSYSWGSTNPETDWLSVEGRAHSPPAPQATRRVVRVCLGAARLIPCGLCYLIAP